MQQIINIGTIPADGTGDPIRTSFDKINQNFSEVYSAAITDSRLRDVPTSSVGQPGDKLGMIAIDATYLYYCTDTYNTTTNIWKRQTLTGGTW